MPWLLAAVALTCALLVSRLAGIPLRDPAGQLFIKRIGLSAGLLVVFAVLDRLIKNQPGRWTRGRILLATGGLTAYHLTYVAYRNLKSWVAFEPIHDRGLQRLDTRLLGGHHPAVVLHAVLGTDTAAQVLEVVYRSFAIVVPVSIVLAVTMLPRMRDGYFYLTAISYCWILGVAVYWLVPSRGPFAVAPDDFRTLRHTKITATQTEYLHERAHLLADSSASGALNSISAFPSLHVGVTFMLLLVAGHCGLRRLRAVLAVYLVGVIVATIYFGWHFLSDDLAGLLLGWAATQLANWTNRTSEAR